MPISRRRFVETLGVAGASAFGGAPALAALTRAPLLKAADSKTLIRLDSNENPNPPGPAVAKAVMEALAEGNRYPNNVGHLADLLARSHGVSRENIFVSNGSGELLSASVPAFVDAKRPLVVPL